MNSIVFHEKYAICDGCGGTVRATWVAEKVVNKKLIVLTFCDHHTAKHEKALENQAWILRKLKKSMATRRTC